MASPNKKPIIALAQIKYSRKSRENVDKIKHYIRLAKSKDADIVCFPEACISLKDRIDPFKLTHKYIKEIQEECKKNSIWCVVTDDFALRDKVFSMALLINRKGEEVGGYRKINLSGDSDLVEAGKKIKVFKTDFGKISIVICWDLILPELFKRIKKKGAEIVFCPAQWHYEEEAYRKKYKYRDLRLLKALVTARAFENFYFVALCNPLTKRKDLISYSAIVAPHKILKQIKNEEGLITAKLNLSEIPKLHKLYGVKIRK
jgi:predicted amidohydrolase